MLSQTEIIIRLVLGAILGGVIGFERQVHGRPAGFRTQLIVCMASVLIMIVSEYYQYLSYMNPAYIRVDPGRIAAGAITGVGFLGAGVILRMGVTIQGLTTAACLWIVSAIGLAVGAGFYLAGIASCALTLFSLLVLRVVERRMSRLVFKFITITADEGIAEEKIESVFKAHNSRTVSTDYEKDILKGEITYNITISLKHDVPMKTILDELSSISGVKKSCDKRLASNSTVLLQGSFLLLAIFPLVVIDEAINVIDEAINVIDEAINTIISYMPVNSVK